MTDSGDDHVVRPGVRSTATLARQDRDGRPSRVLRATVRRRHDLVETARDDGAAPLGEHPSDLLGCGLPLGAAAYDCNLTRHRW